jgi:hypothetical protein
MAAALRKHDVSHALKRNEQTEYNEAKIKMDRVLHGAAAAAAAAGKAPAAPTATTTTTSRSKKAAAAAAK